ncbi:YpbF family protein [Bacillus massilinigeriensis]|uniref:YpbF family protein n=1 Tax=Bacillus mediterraneensis TaxID=1805474 RepID=UPI000A681E60|nr:YpbF family protein [Bacillus mediterraneensis]
MESPIVTLNNRTDEATKRMLLGVVKKKQKFDSAKKKHQVCLLAFVTISAVYIYYLFQNVIEPNSHSAYSVFSHFVSVSANLYWFVLTGGLFGLMNLLRNKREKAEKEFHALRCEIIDKSKDLWKKEEEWKNRHLVFEMMKKQYDINLYHESK